MKRFGKAACTALGIMLLTIPAMAADTIESVKKAWIEQVDKTKSVTFKMTSKSEIEMGAMKTKMDSEGNMEMERKDGKVKFRSEMKMKTSQGSDPAQDSKMLSVCDGEFIYILNDMPQMKSAMKQKADKNMATLGKEQWESLEKDNDLKLLPDEKVDGKDCWVIEATPKKKASPDDKSKVQMWYGKDSGLSLKSTSYDAAGKQTSVTTITDVKLNVDIPADHFVFKAPEGVQVIDMTNMGGDKPADAKADEPKKDAPKADEPKKDEPKKDEPKKDEPKKDEPKKDEPKKPPVKLPGLPK